MKPHPIALPLIVLLAAALGSSAIAKLPAPSDEAKAKAAEAAAKTAHGNKTADFQLCKAQDRIAAQHQAAARKAGKDVKPAVATPPCTDPGPFVYTPPVAASGASAPAAATATAAAPAPAKKP
ncbi:hypothetical protein [Sphaerotilus microaerophilus]|uniref:Uncharacterized protein n=1 Tax=Sphaerotilus microaerophilus TaxID=2914710 RepID=A0ABM7YQL1_9BURK|nr:hypothetical protein [Sphaerotilus sp. FB-5]BDI06797.1 hypothetical protein CATMQ487_37670 [Sphaerotilus sp. FB-5]